MKKRSYELLIANRKYKDTIFRWIFSQIENLLSLYNAVTGKHYQNPEELEIGKCQILRLPLNLTPLL